MADKVSQSNVIHTDDTPMDVLLPSKKNRKSKPPPPPEVAKTKEKKRGEEKGAFYFIALIQNVPFFSLRMSPFSPIFTSSSGLRWQCRLAWQSVLSAGRHPLPSWHLRK
jgi:hypothetical protein